MHPHVPTKKSRSLQTSTFTFLEYIDFIIYFLIHKYFIRYLRHVLPVGRGYKCTNYHINAAGHASLKFRYHIGNTLQHRFLLRA